MKNSLLLGLLFCSIAQSSAAPEASGVMCYTVQCFVKAVRRSFNNRCVAEKMSVNYQDAEFEALRKGDYQAFKEARLGLESDAMSEAQFLALLERAILKETVPAVVKHEQASEKTTTAEAEKTTIFDEMGFLFLMAHSY